MENNSSSTKKKKLRKIIRKKIKNPFVSIDYSSIQLLAGSDLSKRSMPLMSIKSTNPGPVIWLTACIHGDEIGGTVIVQEIFKKIKKSGLLKGEIYVFPLMNPTGFEIASRHITLSKEDLNRAFPGNANGSLAERIADKIFTTIKQTNPTLVLDLHNDWGNSIPYTIIDPALNEIDKNIYQKTKDFAFLSGFPAVLDNEDVKKTLTFNLLKNKIPALALELGESYVINEKDINTGIRCIWNILSELKVVAPIEKSFTTITNPKIKGKLLEYCHHPTSSTSGIIRFLVKPGEIVKKDQPVAKVYNAFGKILETLTAKEEGLVLCYSDIAVAFPGTPIIAIGNLSIRG